jgi:uncharacterized glyoxalase superfamily protein PhnB
VHLDFVVEDITAAVQRASAAGATLEGEIQAHEWGRLAVMSDPFTMVSASCSSPAKATMKSPDSPLHRR